MWGERQGERLPARQNATLTKNLRGGGVFEELIPTFPTSDSLSLDISWLIPLQQEANFSQGFFFLFNNHSPPLHLAHLSCKIASHLFLIFQGVKVPFENVMKATVSSLH